MRKQINLSIFSSSWSINGVIL